MRQYNKSKWKILLYSFCTDKMSNLTRLNLRDLAPVAARGIGKYLI